MFLVGAAAGTFAALQLFLLIAGSRFQTWRQVLAVYLAAAIAVAFISAAGDANAGPPNYTEVPARLLGVAIAFMAELALLRWRRRRRLTKPPNL